MAVLCCLFNWFFSSTNPWFKLIKFLFLFQIIEFGINLKSQLQTVLDKLRTELFCSSERKAMEYNYKRTTGLRTLNKIVKDLM